MRDEQAITRRRILAALGTGTTAGLAGCSVDIGDMDVDVGQEGNTTTTTDTSTTETAGEAPGESQWGPGIEEINRKQVADGVTRSTVVLEDGRTYWLNDEERMVEISERAPDLSGLGGDPLRNGRGSDEEPGARSVGRPTPADYRELVYSAQSRPDKVDLRSKQTPLRDQENRLTCVDFSTVAAMEARLKRQGETVDLCEQYANHVEKMIQLETNRPSSPASESSLGLLGGGGLAHNLAVYSMYGIPAIPADGTPAFRPSGNYGRPWDSGDDPFRQFWNPQGTNQRPVNDFNLAENQISIQIPGTIQVTPFPQDALDEAKYFVENYEIINDGDKLKNPAFYEKQLANDQEVVIDFDSGCTNKGAYWTAKDDTSGCGNGHSVLVVGYDKTGENDYFIVKNSWKDYDRLDYSVITEGLVYRAGMVKSVVTDDDNSFRTDRYLGRWGVRYDGNFALLDIRRLPGFYDAGDLNGKRDRRVGDFWDQGGTLIRANGKIVEDGGRGELELYVDFANRDADYDATSGVTFTARLDHEDGRLLSGTFEKPDGEEAAFYATKGEFFSGSVDASWVSARAMFGRWEIHSPVLDGAVEFRSGTSNGSLTGRHYYGGGSFISTTGTLDLGTNALQIDLPTGSTDWQFDGYVFANEPGVASGTVSAETDDKEHPIVLVRTGPAQTSIEITEPADGATFAAGDAQLSATVEEDDAVVSTDEVVWTLGGPYESGTRIGKGASITHDFTAGTKEIHATYISEDGDALASDVVTVTINSQSAPQVAISYPADGEYFGRDAADGTANGAYADITVSGSASAADGTRLTGESLQWSVREEGGSWEDTGTGETTTVRLTDDACGGVNYEIRLQATDENGTTGSALVTVVVDIISC